MTTFNIGDHVRLTTSFERYPHCLIPSGVTGTVVSTDPDSFAVRWDETIPGLEEWDNEGIWCAEDIACGDLPENSLTLHEQ